MDARTGRPGHDGERTARRGLTKRAVQDLRGDESLVVNHVGKRRVGDTLQRCQRHETIPAAVLVELQQRVAAVDLQTEEAFTHRIVGLDLEIDEQVVEVDAVLSCLEPEDDIAAEIAETVGIVQQVADEIVTSAAMAPQLLFRSARVALPVDVVTYTVCAAHAREAGDLWVDGRQVNHDYRNIRSEDVQCPTSLMKRLAISNGCDRSQKCIKSILRAPRSVPANRARVR